MPRAQAMAGFSSCAVGVYSKTVISRHEPDFMAGFSSFVVPPNGKTGKSCHERAAMAEYSGFVVSMYDRTGISCLGTECDFRQCENLQTTSLISCSAAEDEHVFGEVV